VIVKMAKKVHWDAIAYKKARYKPGGVRRSSRVQQHQIVKPRGKMERVKKVYNETFKRNPTLSPSKFGRKNMVLASVEEVFSELGQPATEKA